MRRKFVTNEYKKGQEAFKHSREYEEILQQMEDMTSEMDRELDEIEARIQTLPKSRQDELMRRLKIKRDIRKRERLLREARKYDITFSAVEIIEYDRYVEVVAATDDHSERRKRIRNNRDEDLLREQLAEQNVRKTRKLVNRILKEDAPNYRLKRGTKITFRRMG